MRNIQKLINELVSRGFFAGCVGNIIVNFIKRNGGIKDIDEKDIKDIIATVTAMKFGTGLNLSDKWLPVEHQRKTDCLIAEACICQNTTSQDVSKIFALYLEICDRNMLLQT